jgi:transposase
MLRIRRNKTDAVAICEAVSRPTTRFAPLREVEDQSSP